MISRQTLESSSSTYARLAISIARGRCERFATWGKGAATAAAGILQNGASTPTPEDSTLRLGYHHGEAGLSQTGRPAGAHTFWRYSVMIEDLSLADSFCSIDEIIFQLALRAPTAFLYATDKRLRSSTVRSTSIFAIAAVAFTISSYLPACSASLAM
jgi:hypothetical protein